MRAIWNGAVLAESADTVVVEGTPGSPGPPTQGMSKEKAAEAKEKFKDMTTPPTIPFPNR